MFKHWKNITIYKLSREADLTDLEDKKKMILFTPCGSQDMAKFGFVSPFGDNSEVIAMHGNGFILVEAKRETKILPPPVIQRAIQEKIEKLEQEQARKLKKTEKDSLKDEVLHSLLPRAFSKFSVIQAIYDGSTKRIYINASARQAPAMLLVRHSSCLPWCELFLTTGERCPWRYLWRVVFCLMHPEISDTAHTHAQL